MIIDVIIPAFNEEESIKHVLNDIPKDIVREIIVVNNNSTDNTELVAHQNGAKVIFEKEKGYGRACLKGVEYLSSKSKKPYVVVFLDADYSDYPEQMKDLVRPIIQKEMDLVIGSRVMGNAEKKSMTLQQRFGNWLATRLILLIYGFRYTDLGPFRAIDFNKLLDLNMTDKNYGWTVEMQLKAVKKKLRVMEVPVDYRKRIGMSKISGTIKGTILAGYKIITTIFKYSFSKSCQY